MQFLTASTLLYARVAFLLVIGFFFVTDAESVINSNFALLLGQAMELPMVQVSATNPLLGILSVALFTLAVSDLIPLLADNVDYFETIVPTRLAAFFALAAYTYLSDFELLANNVVFTYAFFEIWFNVLIYSNLRNEKYYRLKKFVEEHGEEIQRQENEQVRVVELDE